MNFGGALKALKSGEKVAREGWNGKGMFVYMVGKGSYEPTTEVAKQLVSENGTVDYEPYLAIKNVKGTVSTWVPNINDCLAEDWVIVQ